MTVPAGFNPATEGVGASAATSNSAALDLDPATEGREGHALTAADAIATWRPGSAEWSWDAERAALRDELETYRIMLRAQPWAGPPVLLGDDGRIWDGHHRLCALLDVDPQRQVPVEYGTSVIEDASEFGASVVSSPVPVSREPTPEEAMNDDERQWQAGDYAWLDGGMWRRLSLSPNWTSESGDHRTDAEMTAEGAALVATADGPAPSAGSEVREEWGVRTRAGGVINFEANERMARKAAQSHQVPLLRCTATLTTARTPWTEVQP